MIPIDARGLTKHFGNVVAVDGVTFSIEPGKVTGFLGRKGRQDDNTANDRRPVARGPKVNEVGGIRIWRRVKRPHDSFEGQRQL